MGLLLERTWNFLGQKCGQFVESELFAAYLAISSVHPTILAGSVKTWAYRSTLKRLQSKAASCMSLIWSTELISSLISCDRLWWGLVPAWNDSRPAGLWKPCSLQKCAWQEFSRREPPLFRSSLFPPPSCGTHHACVCVCPDNYQLIVLCSISLGASLIFLNLFCIPNFYPVNLSVDVLRPYLTVLFWRRNSHAHTHSHSASNTHWCSHMLTAPVRFFCIGSDPALLNGWKPVVV